MKHTPTPWVTLFGPDTINIGVDGEFADGHNFMWVAELSVHSLIGVEEAKANAAHIVKCVNLHDELVDILSDSLSSFRLTQNPNHYPNDSWCRRAMSVLAKARGEATNA